jgi:predicted ATP-dependent serine protease
MGEIRRASQMDVRLEEAKKLGFKMAIVPKSAASLAKRIDGLALRTIASIQDLPSVLKA